MKHDRRTFLKGIGGALFVSLADYRILSAKHYDLSAVGYKPINIIIPREYTPPVDYSAKEYQYRLSRATLEVLESNFSRTTMPVWKKTFGEVDFEKRITNIVYWVIAAVRSHANIYPVDPAWIMAQIMKESYFYEFAVSSALAVGICQFIQPTAKSHDMLCAGQKQAHYSPPYRQTNFAGKADDYYRIRSERRSYSRQHRPANVLSFKEAMEIIHSGRAAQHSKTAGEYLTYLQKLQDYDVLVDQARDDFKTYLQANIEDKDIFDESDLNFILNFDERFTYKKPAYGMVKMVARGLRSRSGNILAAAGGYNAGLNSTRDDGMYEPYGRIPIIDQTTTYISHVLINHHEITSRME